MRKNMARTWLVPKSKCGGLKIERKTRSLNIYLLEREKERYESYLCSYDLSHI